MEEPAPFDFADVALPHAELRAHADDAAWLARLRARAERGPAPLCAAAALVERGDARFGPMLAALAAYLDPPDVPALGKLGSVDALCAAASSRSTPMPVRQAAIDELGRAAPTSASLCVLAEIAEGGGPEHVGLRASDALGAVRLLADKNVRADADKLRARLKQVRGWTGIRRQELLRDVSTGALHPATGLLGGDPEFLASLIPPITDEARPPLLPSLLANAREAAGETRAKTFALFRGRWRELAREPLCALARFASLRGHDSDLPARAVSALAALGCTRELVIVAAMGTAPARVAALGALEQAAPRGVGEADRALTLAASRRLTGAGEAGAAEILRKLAEA